MITYANSVSVVFVTKKYIDVCLLLIGVIQVNNKFCAFVLIVIGQFNIDNINGVNEKSAALNEDIEAESAVIMNATRLSQQPIMFFDASVSSYVGKSF